MKINGKAKQAPMFLHHGVIHVVDAVIMPANVVDLAAAHPDLLRW